MLGRSGGVIASICLSVFGVCIDSAFAQGTAAYQKACSDAGVPLPPSFGVPNGSGGFMQNPLWVSTNPKGKPLTVPNKLVFDGDKGGNWRTRVWVYRRPAAQGGGICIALPRSDSGNVSLLGVICQSDGSNGAKTVSACFFDNVNMKPPPPKLTGTDIPSIPINLFQGGDQLKENCTECHLGNNAFLVIPDTPEVQTGTGVPDDVFYTPISGAKPRPTWVNMPMPQKFTVPVKGGGTMSYMLSGPGNGCQSCHGLGQPTKKYCLYLKKVLAGKYPDGTLLMPPHGKMLSDDEQTDVTALNAFCANLLSAS